MPNKSLPKRPVQAALELLYQALETGVRGRNKDAIEYAVDILEDNGRGDLKDIHYRNLKIGDKDLTDPQRPGFRMQVKKSGKFWAYRYKSPVDGKDKVLFIGSYPDMELG